MMRTGVVNGIAAGAFTFFGITHAAAATGQTTSPSPSGGTLTIILIAGLLSGIFAVLVAVITVVGPPLFNRWMDRSSPVKETKAASNDELVAVLVERQQDVEILRKQLKEHGVDPDA